MEFTFASGPGSFLPTNMPVRPACTWLWFLTSTSHSQQLGLHERCHSGVLLRRRLLRGTVVRCAASDETRCVVAPTWTNQASPTSGKHSAKSRTLATRNGSCSQIPDAQHPVPQASANFGCELPALAKFGRYSGLSDHRAQPPHEASRPQSTIRDEYPDCDTDNGNCCSIFVRRLDAPRRSAGGAQHAASGSL